MSQADSHAVVLAHVCVSRILRTLVALCLALLGYGGSDMALGAGVMFHPLVFTSVSSSPLAVACDWDSCAITGIATGGLDYEVETTVMVVDGKAIEGVDSDLASSTTLFWPYESSAETHISLNLVAGNGMVEFGSAMQMVNENAGYVDLVLERRDGTDLEATVNIITDSVLAQINNATENVDYAKTAAIVTFAPGETRKSLRISIMDDSETEGTEVFRVRIVSAIGCEQGSVDSCVVTIIDDEGTGKTSLGAAAYQVIEGESAIVTVVRSGGSYPAVTVNYATTDEGTAVAGQDFEMASGTLAFAEGETTRSFTIKTLDDPFKDPGETIKIRLLVPFGNSEASEETAIISIEDNDQTPGKIQFTKPIYSICENGALISIGVSRVDGLDDLVSVDYTTVTGRARAGADFQQTSGTLTFAEGIVSQTILIPITDDTVYEGDETFVISLSNVRGGATIGDKSTCVVTIKEDERAPAFFVTISNPIEGGHLNTSTPRISGNARGTTAVRISVDGREPTTASVTADSWSLTTSLTEGIHTVSAVASTQEGTTIMVGPVGFAVDLTPPDVIVVTPEPESFTNQNRIEISGVVHNASSFSIFVDGTLHNKLDVALPEGFTQVSDTLSDGIHTLLVNAIDDAGNEASESVTFFVDTVPPTVMICLPENFCSVPNRPLLVSGTAETGVTVTVFLDGYDVAFDSPVPDGNGTWATATPPLLPGIHIIRVVACDSARNSATSEILVIAAEEYSDPDKRASGLRIGQAGRGFNQHMVPDFNGLSCLSRFRSIPHTAGHLSVRLTGSLDIRVLVGLLNLRIPKSPGFQEPANAVHWYQGITSVQRVHGVDANSFQIHDREDQASTRELSMASAVRCSSPLALTDASTEAL